MASSLSSSSDVHKIKYDVYINFRGSDIRHGFLSHLTKELHQKHIDVYVDERLEKGDEISLSLLKAIEGSLISLIIFSKDYASSKWCLEELVKIMEYKEVNGQIVIPVFYNVDPSHVRHQKGTYEDAFVQLEQELKNDIDELQIFRSSLNSAANLSGYHHSFNFENDSELVEAIVKDLLKKLDFIHPSESAGLVGIYQHLARIEPLLTMEASAVKIIGIWGMGGIGKTTIAQAVYENFFLQYERGCFLENVREESQRYGLSSLRDKLVSQLQEEKSTFLKKRLSRKKVLIVLDDVSTPEQLKYLVKEQISLGSDSRVIVTSRDRHVLISGGARAIHEVKGLNFKDALELFCLNAFNKNHPKKGFEELSKGAVAYASGNPLALKVLGSYLHSRNIGTWECTLRKLKKYPNEQIQNVLKLSYDGLDPMEKDIFLDIVFFYKGENKEDVMRLLDACHFFASSGIDSLLDKALITISYNCIQMHDLIQEMGWEVVRQDSRKDLGRRTRLRDVEEVYEVLKHNKGTDVIEAIMLDMSQIRDVHLSVDTFKKMTNLRLLKFYSSEFSSSCLHLPKGFKSFSDKLRYLEWDGYSLESLPPSFCAENLVELHMRYSLVQKLWDGVQELMNLRRLDLWGSKQLKELPNFSKAPNLAWVQLSYCESLCHVHPSLLSLPRLVSLQLSGCENLKSFQSESFLQSLEQLAISGCFGQREFSLCIKEIIDLRFSGWSIKIYHSSSGHISTPTWLYFNGSTLKIHQADDLYCLKSLEVPILFDCRQVNEKSMLNIEIGDLRSIRELHLDGCSNICYISESITHLSLLRELRLKGCGVKSLPACITFLIMLELLDLSNCKRLGSLPELPKSIKHLNINNCTSLNGEFIVTSFLHNYSVRFLSLINCMELCEYNIMEDAYLLFQPSPSMDNICVCYPGSRVPQWFKNNWTAKDSMTVELSPHIWDLSGFVCCFVLRQFNSEQKSRIHLNWQCYFEDGKEVQGTNDYNMDMITELSSDHIFLLCDGFCSRQIWRGLLDKRRDDQGTTHSQKLSFKFSVVVNNGMVKHDDLLKECGVCPLYISEYEAFLLKKRIKRGQIWRHVLEKFRYINVLPLHDSLDLGSLAELSEPLFHTKKSKGIKKAPERN